MENKKETHPHAAFVPVNATILIIGSFPPAQHSNPENDEWYYQSKRNQFWKIFREIYQKPLQTVAEKKQLFSEKGIAITDLFLEIERTGKGNSNQLIKVIKYNENCLKHLFEKQQFRKILFTSQFVASHFSKIFPEIKGENLPSPSPRFARMSIQEKIEVYRKYLPE